MLSFNTCFIHKKAPCTSREQSYPKKRHRLLVRVRVAFPYTFAVDVVNLNLSSDDHVATSSMSDKCAHSNMTYIVRITYR